MQSETFEASVKSTGSFGVCTCITGITFVMGAGEVNREASFARPPRENMDAAFMSQDGIDAGIL